MYGTHFKLGISIHAGEFEYFYPYMIIRFTLIRISTWIWTFVELWQTVNIDTGVGQRLILYVLEMLADMLQFSVKCYCQSDIGLPSYGHRFISYQDL